MPCHAMHPMQDYFWKVFHKYYNLICIFYMHSYLHKIFILVKSGCYNLCSRKPSIQVNLLETLQTWHHCSLVCRALVRKYTKS
jgi:hypothetical protein